MTHQGTSETSTHTREVVKMKRSDKVFVNVSSAFGGHHLQAVKTLREVTYGTVQRWIKVAGSHDPMRHESRFSSDGQTETVLVSYFVNGCSNRVQFRIFPR